MRSLTAFNLKLSLSLFVIIVLLIGCKKNKDDEPTPSSSSLPTSFQVSIDDGFYPNFIDEDNKQNTYLLGADNTGLMIKKLNKDGDVVWSRGYQDINGKISKLHCLNDNSLIIMSKGGNIQDPISIGLMGWDQIGINGGNNCAPRFEYGDIDMIEVTGKTYITKIDTAGEIAWSKEFDESYAGPQSIVNYPDDKFVLVTMKLHGKYPELVLSEDGVFLDTAFCSLNKNSLKLYNISSDGNINWEKQFDNIYNGSYTRVSCFIDVMVSSHNITIKTEKELMYLDYQGNEIDNLVIYPEQCSNRLNSMFGTSNSRILISGNYSIYNQPPNGYDEYSYTKLIDQSGNELWQIDNYTYIVDISKQRLDNYQCFAYWKNGKLNMADINGNILWTIDEASYMPPECVIINSDLGVTYATCQYGSPIVITKTNSEGLVD